MGKFLIYSIYQLEFVKMDAAIRFSLNSWHVLILMSFKVASNFICIFAYSLYCIIFKLCMVKFVTG